MACAITPVKAMSIADKLYTALPRIENLSYDPIAEKKLYAELISRRSSDSAEWWSGPISTAEATTSSVIPNEPPINHQDSIGKRVLAGIEQITKAVEDGTVTLEAGEFALMILVEGVSHFCTPDVSRLASDVLKAYRIQIKDVAAAAEADKVIQVTAPADEEAW